MTERSHCLNLAFKPGQTDFRHEFGTQHLDRHIARMPNIHAEVDDGHATAAKFTLDGISTTKGKLQLFNLTRHVNNVPELREVVPNAG